jgi:hypothetical protein
MVKILLFFFDNILANKLKKKSTSATGYKFGFSNEFNIWYSCYIPITTYNI